MHPISHKTAFTKQEIPKLPKELPFWQQLGGKSAFYNSCNYEKATKADFSQKNVLPVSYTWNSEHRILRIIKRVLSLVIFPIGIYHLLHILAAKFAILPSSTPALLGITDDYAQKYRDHLNLKSDWKYKRLTIEVDGYKIDAAIMGTDETLANGRWVLASNGNGEFYEEHLAPRSDFKQLLRAVSGNGIVFNYAGVGASSGLPSRNAMKNAYRAILSFLEDEKRGIGAKEIIGYGHSIGGGVQGDALRYHKLKNDIHYVFVKSRTFSTLSQAASKITCRILGLLVKLLGWNMDSLESSKKLQAGEIILQTAKVIGYERLQDSSKIVGDGVIPAKAALARALLKDKTCPKDNKMFIGINESHNARLKNPHYLVDAIEEMLAR